MLVMKFDAGSIASEDRLKGVARLVRQHLGRHPLVVTSALPRVTDLLLEAARQAEARDGEYEDRLEEIRDEHERIARCLLPEGAARKRLLEHVAGLLGEARTFCTAVYALEELTPRTLDALAATGERLSCELVTAALVQEGLRAQAVDARGVLVTDDTFCSATPLMPETEQRARLSLRPLVDTGVVPVLGGFMGATQKGVTTTLGRGGADGTAAVLGAVLGAEEIQIWTETDAMTTVDPRVAAGARVISQVSAEEAAELAYFGTKVLHPVMIRPAVEAGIPVRVLNTQEPEAPGTLVSPRENLGPSGPCAVVSRKGITVLLVSEPRMLMASGFLARVFEVFERLHTPVDLIATSEVSVSVTVDSVERLAEIKAELARLGEVRILREMAIVALVGRGFFRYAGLSRRIFDALADVNVVMISFAASDVNISIVVEEADTERAVHALHREFFAEPRA
ncbi:MAG TPA: aspartate kinase [Vicinamibacteria bacterium]|nr:aspartate kinase [Vicinamibacteria bacterium]